MHLASSFPLVLWSIALSGLPPSATLFWLAEDNARGLGESESYILRVKTDAHVELSLKKMANLWIRAIYCANQFMPSHFMDMMAFL